jgi:hypothetical protein
MYNVVVMDRKRKTTAIPVRFEPCEDQFLRKAASDTGLTVAELVRRSVRLLKRQTKAFQNYSFVLDLNE